MLKNMTKSRIWIYDTSLRDGQQTQGVDFSVEEKLRVTALLDELGVDYIEGGWPGANPTDSEFFSHAPKTQARMTAFGMTRRLGRSVENDDVLAAVLNAQTEAICLVGKAHDFHVKEALGISLEENLSLIESSIAYIVQSGREALFDAEHFFDGYESNPDYALQCLMAARDAGARWLVLCDTNGGVMPKRAGQIVQELIAKGLSGDELGIHAHNDTEQAVAVSMAAIAAGVRQVQGTVNGLGERCGNANLVTIIANLALKPPFCEKFETQISAQALKNLTKISRNFDEILNRTPLRQAAYVGSSAFAHKAGLHVSAILKHPQTYEHIDPERVGNARMIPMSNQAGLSNLRKRLSDAGISVVSDDPKLSEILEAVKEREDRGYAYDSATASFEILARKILGNLPNFFEVKRYRVLVERRKNKYNQMVSVSEALVSMIVDNERILSVSESRDDDGNDLGPVNALWRALTKEFSPYQEIVQSVHLSDYRVRISGQGTDAVTRVLIDFQDDKGRVWSTVGVSPNIVDASFEALVDAIIWRLLQE